LTSREGSQDAASFAFERQRLGLLLKKYVCMYRFYITKIHVHLKVNAQDFF
jgi:hypothetical protein